MSWTLVFRQHVLIVNIVSNIENIEAVSDLACVCKAVATALNHDGVWTAWGSKHNLAQAQGFITTLAKLGKASQIRRLIKAGIDPSVNGNEPFRQASFGGHIHAMRELLAHPAVDPSVDKCSIFTLACYQGNTRAMRILLNETNIDPTALDNMGIECASRNGHVDAVRLLLVDGRADRQVGLKMARMFKQYDVVELINTFADGGQK